MGACCRADWIHLTSGQTLHGEVISKDDNFVVVRLLSGEVKLKASSVESIEKQTPQEYKLELGSQLISQRRYDRGIQILEEGFVLDKTSAAAKRKLAAGYAEAGPFYKSKNRLDDARDICEKWMKLDPGGKSAELMSAQARKLLDEVLDSEKQVEDALSNAKTLAEGGDYNSAIAVFERATALSPGARKLVAADIANCYVSRASAHARAGRQINAAADVEAALSYDPSLADKLEQFYVSCALPGMLDNIGRGQIAQAQADARRVLGLVPANKAVLYVAGRIEEAGGKLPAAAEFYCRAYNMKVGNPSSAFVASMRARLEKDLNVKGDAFSIDTGFADGSAFTTSIDGPAQTKESENFQVIHFNSALAEKVSEAAEFCRSDIAARMGLAPQWKGKIKIIIHRTQAEYTARTAQPEWTGGCSKFTLEAGRMTEAQIHSWQTSPRLLKSVLPHEMTHLLINSNMQDVNALPRSLHEGFAVAMEPTYRHEYFNNFLRARVKSRDFIPLSDLLTLRDYPRDPEFFYAEGYSLLNFIAGEKGLAQTAGLVRGVHAGGAEQDLLRLSGRRSIDDLQNDWIEWLGKNGKVKVESLNSKK